MIVLFSALSLMAAAWPMMALIDTGNLVLARGFTPDQAHDERLVLDSDNPVKFNNRIRQAWPKNVKAIEKAVAATLTDPVRDAKSQKQFIQLQDIHHQILFQQHMLESQKEALEEEKDVILEAEIVIADLIKNSDRAARSPNRGS